MEPTNDWVGLAQAAYHAGKRVALLFDYDGTLTPIAPHPALAILPECARESLRELAHRDRFAVGVISSRRLADVSAMVGLKGLYYVGGGGTEIDLLGIREDCPFSVEMLQILSAAEAEIRNDLAQFPGVWIEPKRYGFTVHYRSASAVIAEAFAFHFGRLIGRFQDLRHLDVCMAYEVSPANGWDKGTAADRILGMFPKDAFPLYFGDADNDRPGMAAVQQAGGVAVVIGATLFYESHYRLVSPAMLHVDLSRLCKHLTDTPAPGVGTHARLREARLQPRDVRRTG